MLEAIMAQVKENGFQIFIVRALEGKSLPSPDPSQLTLPLRENQQYVDADVIKIHQQTYPNEALNFDGASQEDLEAAIKASMMSF